ncbi:MAG: WD40/YVTN/BNR-like repeat-containing protein [Chloroflexota bacterium]
MTAITSIWINEGDANRVCCGFANGDVQATADSALLAGATWSKLVTLPAAVEDIAESPEQLGQYWACSGRYLYLTFDGFASYGPFATFPEGAVARKLSNSAFGNFVSATVPAGSGASPVRWADDDEEMTMPVLEPPVEDVRALAHHLYEDKLFAVDVLGRVLYKPPDSLTMEHVLTLSDFVAEHGEVRRMIRDNANQNVYMIVCANALIKTFDGFKTVVKVRGYVDPLFGRQLGMGQLGRRLINGRRVAALGTGGTAALRFIWTENCQAIAPVWQENSTGLPDANYCTVNLAPDKGGEVAYIRNGNSLYRNSAYRTGGVWQEVLNKAIAEAAIGQTYDYGLALGQQIGVSAAAPGYVVVACYCTHTTSLWDWVVLHSHDYGATWTATIVRVGTGAASYRTVHGAAVGLTNGQRVYGLFGDGASGSAAVYGSADGGHTWSAGLTFANTSAVGRQLVIQKEGNPNDLIATVSGYQMTERTTDGWASSIPWGNAGWVPVWAGQGGLAAGYGMNTNNGTFRTADLGQTWALAYGWPYGTHIERIVCVTPELWYCANRGQSAGIWLCRTQALDEWSTCNGNLFSGLGIANCWALDVDMGA